MTLCHCTLRKTSNISCNFCGIHPTTGFFNKKIVWNAQGQTIRLFDKRIGHNGLGDLYLEVSPNTLTWRHLLFRLLEYKQFYQDATTNQHNFGELTDFMFMYPKY